MNKLKKYIYPPTFSIGFIVFWQVLVITIHLINYEFDREGYGGLGLGLLILFIWLVFVLPIYCIIYSKIITGEKLKIVFSVYNSLFIIVSHLLSFNLWNKIVIIIFALWVLFWNMVPLIWRYVSQKYEEKHSS